MLLRRHAELRLHAWRIERLVRHRVDERDALVDELREILVAGRDHAAPALAACLGCERRDHVVGFHAVDRQHRPAERGDQLLQRLDLHREVVGHRGAVRLVLADTDRRETSCPSHRTRTRVPAPCTEPRVAAACSPLRTLRRSARRARCAARAAREMRDTGRTNHPPATGFARNRDRT